jgi:hypothetical protein
VDRRLKFWVSGVVERGAPEEIDERLFLFAESVTEVATEVMQFAFRNELKNWIVEEGPLCVNVALLTLGHALREATTLLLTGLVIQPYLE